MESAALYPGSFNPLHRGHMDVISKALRIFDKVVLARGINPAKCERIPVSPTHRRLTREEFDKSQLDLPKKLEYFSFITMLPAFVNLLDTKEDIRITAVIRGLRNGHDLQHEMTQQYWYEDLGLTVPVIMMVTDRSLAHISSSMIRAVMKFP